MCRKPRGRPRSDMRIVTWWSDSGESDQKSHIAALLRRLDLGCRFCVWMKSGNLYGSPTTRATIAGRGRSFSASNHNRDHYHHERIHDSQSELNRHRRGATGTTRRALFVAKPKT